MSQVKAVAQLIEQAELKAPQRLFGAIGAGQLLQRSGIIGEQLWIRIVSMQQPQQKLVQIETTEQSFAAQRDCATSYFSAGQGFKVGAASKR